MSQNQINQWLQLNVGLIRKNGSALASARDLFKRISLLIEQWHDDPTDRLRQRGRLQCYFFMRKPPDIRMRFLISDRATDAMLELSICLEILQKEGKIGEFFFSDYPAEIECFGGLEAMEYVHKYFDRDTTNWLRSDSLSQQQQPTIVPEVMLPAVFQDLFWQALLDRQQVLDTWLVLASMTPLAANVIVPDLEFPDLDTLATDVTLVTEVTSILSSYREANQHLARGLICLNQRGLLITDLTIILATVALFNFNRHGFGGDRSSVLVASVVKSVCWS
jgi:thiopeptide-type bacteriocin biosynthesis protein